MYRHTRSDTSDECQASCVPSAQLDVGIAVVNSPLHRHQQVTHEKSDKKKCIAKLTKAKSITNNESRWILLFCYYTFNELNLNCLAGQRQARALSNGQRFLTILFFSVRANVTYKFKNENVRWQKKSFWYR